MTYLLVFITICLAIIVARHAFPYLRLLVVWGYVALVRLAFPLGVWYEKIKVSF